MAEEIKETVKQDAPVASAATSASPAAAAPRAPRGKRGKRQIADGVAHISVNFAPIDTET